MVIPEIMQWLILLFTFLIAIGSINRIDILEQRIDIVTTQIDNMLELMKLVIKEQNNEIDP